MQPKKWHPFTLFLHLVIAVAVITQLTTSWLFDDYHTLFLVHEYSGMTAFVAIILLLLWKWHLSGLKQYFPWAFSTGRHKMLEDLRWLCKIRLPEHNTGGLPGTVQGLGVLLIFTMGFLGTLWFIAKHYVVGLEPYTHTMMYWHSALANLVWAYIIGHGCMAILHWILPKRFKIKSE